MRAEPELAREALRSFNTPTHTTREVKKKKKNQHPKRHFLTQTSSCNPAYKNPHLPSPPTPLHINLLRLLIFSSPLRHCIIRSASSAYFFHFITKWVRFLSLQTLLLSSSIIILILGFLPMLKFFIIISHAPFAFPRRF
jgi:hypothetical protein